MASSVTDACDWEKLTVRSRDIPTAIWRGSLIFARPDHIERMRRIIRKPSAPRSHVVPVQDHPYPRIPCVRERCAGVICDTVAEPIGPSVPFLSLIHDGVALRRGEVDTVPGESVFRV